MNQDTQKPTDWLDGTAVALSALCLVHCLALPLVVAGLPFLAQFSEGHLHAQVLVVVLPRSAMREGDHVLVVDREQMIHIRQVEVLRWERDFVVIAICALSPLARLACYSS